MLGFFNSDTVWMNLSENSEKFFKNSKQFFMWQYCNELRNVGFKIKQFLSDSTYGWNWRFGIKLPELKLWSFTNEIQILISLGGNEFTDNTTEDLTITISANLLKSPVYGSVLLIPPNWYKPAHLIGKGNDKPRIVLTDARVRFSQPRTSLLLREGKWAGVGWNFRYNCRRVKTEGVNFFPVSRET